MNGTNIIASASLGNPGPTWHAVGTGDFNGDGHSDILWQNDDGTVAIWELNGTSVIGTAIVGNPGPSWHVVGTGDYNGDGFSDIRFRIRAAKSYIWEMNGTNIIGSGSLGNPGAELARDGRQRSLRAGECGSDLADRRQRHRIRERQRPGRDSG